MRLHFLNNGFQVQRPGSAMDALLGHVSSLFEHQFLYDESNNYSSDAWLFLRRSKWWLISNQHSIRCWTVDTFLPFSQMRKQSSQGSGEAMAWVSSVPRHVRLGWECFLHFTVCCVYSAPFGCCSFLSVTAAPCSPDVHACCLCHTALRTFKGAALCQLWSGCAEHRGYQKPFYIQPSPVTLL